MTTLLVILVVSLVGASILWGYIFGCIYIAERFGSNAGAFAAIFIGFFLIGCLAWLLNDIGKSTAHPQHKEYNDAAR